MKRLRQLAMGFALLLVLPMGAMQNLQPIPLSAGSATITDLNGRISIQLPQGPIVNAQRGAILTPGTIVEVEKGNILLGLQDGSQILIKSRSRVVLRSPSNPNGYWLELLMGKIVAKVQKRLGETPAFRMGTPTAVITVRGTRFSVEVTKKQRTLVDVFEGIVQVDGFGPQSRGVLVRPGFGTGVNLGRQPDEPRRPGSLGEDSGGGASEDQSRTPGSLREDGQTNTGTQPREDLAPGGQSNQPRESERDH
jgi:hypothetical protein